MDVTSIGDGFAVYGSIGVDPEIGDPDLAEVLQIELYADTTGSIDLADVDNSNYATCTHCIRLIQDVDPFSIGPQFFQVAGTIELDDDPLDGTLSATLVDVELAEVEIDEGSFESTLVPGGACVLLVSPSPVAAPA